MTPQEYARHRGRVAISGDNCWIWQGALTKPTRPGTGGYALANVGGKTTLLHRAMYEHVIGPIAPGATLDHLCRARNCVNPSHLEPVTSQENILRGYGPTAENAIKTHCPQGHLYDGANLYVDKSGRRHCRVCRRARSNQWWQDNGTAYLKARKERNGKQG